ncbi:DUF1640 domain-containing protein [uncultured Methylobacterium sp.]|jgi:hypothetical protein|uniref:DUF1640 domain-containing protein n=1 Tax=uncultured Methylobacterium sp. TaxID=157278 RepID=UPI00263A2562|nr:DUF1640 domain-containing protein [uncultured Methylobacterium sp.]
MSASSVLKLQKAGFSTEQVEALADFMDTQAASKADLEAAVHKLELGQAGLRKDLDLGLAGVRSEIADVRGELRLLEQRMTVRLGGMLVAAVGVLIAAMRYLPSAGH